MRPWLVDALLAVVAGHADAPAGPHHADFNRWVYVVVHEDADSWRSRAAAIDGQLCARLLTWVGQVPAPAPRHDYVHADLNLSNALHVGEQLTGIVDLEDFGVGDRTVDLARLAFEAHKRSDESAARIMAAGRAAGGEPGWRAAVAYELIGRLGWRGAHGYTADWGEIAILCRTFLDRA